MNHVFCQCNILHIAVLPAIGGKKKHESVPKYGKIIFLFKEIQYRVPFLVSIFSLTAFTASFKIKIKPSNAVILNMKKRKLFI